MKLEVFTEILNRLRKQSDKEHALYVLDIDTINFSDNYTSVINILLEVYYGKDGADWISWYLWERDKDGSLDQATDKDGNKLTFVSLTEAGKFMKSDRHSIKDWCVMNKFNKGFNWEFSK